MIITDLKKFVICAKEDKKFYLFDFNDEQTATAVFNNLVEETKEESKTNRKTTTLMFINSQTKEILQDLIIDDGTIYN